MGNSLKIFISYRRADSEDFAGRLHDNLVRVYANVFLDTEDGVGAGERFLNVIVKEIEKADVFLMLVGKKSKEEFKKREDKDDYVLKEILHAKASNCKIIPLLLNGVDDIDYLPDDLNFIRELSYYQFSHTKFSLNLEGLKHEINKCTPKIEELNSAFAKEVLNEVQNQKLIVLFYQDFTDISTHLKAIQTKIKSKFPNHFYTVSIPPFVDEEEEYFACVAKDCGLDCKVKKVSDWNNAMQEKLKSSSEPLLLFITDLEDGNEIFDKQFATILRKLKNRFSHFHAILVGRKALATLVYAEGILSPLNNVKEMFFPEQELKLDEGRIVQEFNRLGKYKEQICKLLKREKIARFSTWYHNETINTLFWKNLLVKEGSHLVWRGELTKEIARDVLECDEDVV